MKLLQLLIWNSILLVCFQSFGQNHNLIDSLSSIKKSNSKKLFEELYQNEKRPVIVINNLFFDNIDNLPTDEIKTMLVLKDEEAVNPSCSQ